MDFGTSVPAPPDIPKSLVSLQLDGKGTIELNQAELRTSLTRLGTHFKEATSRCLTTLRNSLEQQFDQKLLNVSLKVSEAAQDLQTQLAKDPRIRQVEDTLGDLQATVDQLEKKQEALLDKVKEAVERAEAAAVSAVQKAEGVLEASALEEALQDSEEESDSRRSTNSSPGEDQKKRGEEEGQEEEKKKDEAKAEDRTPSIPAAQAGAKDRRPSIPAVEAGAKDGTPNIAAVEDGAADGIPNDAVAEAGVKDARRESKDSGGGSRPATPDLPPTQPGLSSRQVSAGAWSESASLGKTKSARAGLLRALENVVTSEAHQEDLDRLQEEVDRQMSKTRERLEGLREFIYETNDKVSAVKSATAGFAPKLQALEGRLAADNSRLTRRIADLEERVGSHWDALAIEKDKVGTLEERLPALELQLEPLREGIEQLSREKAEKDSIEAVDDKCEELRIHLEQISVIPRIEGRIRELDKLVRSHDGLFQETEEQASLLRQDTEDLAERMNSLAHQSQLTQMEDDFYARLDIVSKAEEAFGERVVSVEAALADAVQQLGAMEGKADVQDVHQLRNSISALANDLREKEQAVLFGARCLSCNRVFENTSKDPGTVNLELERQKTQVLSEIQRALRSPRLDPEESIKMIAVKVGRPATLPAKSGPGSYPVRDAESLSTSMEDVHFIRPQSQPQHRRPSSRQSQPSRQLVDTSMDSVASVPGPVSELLRPGTPGGTGGSLTARSTTKPRPHSVAEGDIQGLSWKGSKSTPRSPEAPSSLAAVRERRCESDFKHPLSHLLGRSTGTQRRWPSLQLPPDRGPTEQSFA